MRYFFNCKFEPKTVDGRFVIDLISIGIVRENGRRFYAEREGFDWSTADPWLVVNVKPHLTGDTEPLSSIRDRVLSFINSANPEFWAYVGAYNWLCLMEIVGGIPKRPTHWPNRYREIMDLVDAYGLSKSDLPEQIGPAHNALNDAEWGRQAHHFIVGSPAR
jgi:hypothetical protein